jgi:hypothetical protein
MAGGADRQRLLYYFTSVSDVPAIIAGRVVPTDAAIKLGPIARVTARRADGLVWLTDCADLLPDQARGAAAVRPGLRAVAGGLARVTVSVPDAHYWPQWARRHGIGRDRQRRIDRAAGGLSGRWWIVARPIPTAEWLRIESVAGARMWPAPEREANAGAPRVPALSAYRRAGVDWPGHTPQPVGDARRPQPK